MDRNVNDGSMKIYSKTGVLNKFAITVSATNLCNCKEV